MLKDDLISYLKVQTASFDSENISDNFTTRKIAEHFSIKRNTASHYLNQLNIEKKIVKINTRPVYFFHKNTFEEKFYLLSKFNYISLKELKREETSFQNDQDPFHSLIGSDYSLGKCIEQLKTAALYPGNGLPVLLTGESGTGKSYIVKIMYQFCLANNIIEKNAPFVTINCAQYANNPELLTSQLFGHIKGAYTGAYNDKQGAFEAAEGGILFLDEVHRLNAEGQEKLFTYLDQGVIYRMGETNRPKSVKTRLFFATTEDLSSKFLKTFIRRIPIQVELPSLSKRTQNERLQMVYEFFISEQQKINKKLLVSGQVLYILKNGFYKGNIGELKNNVKVATANAFSKQKNQEEISVTIQHLPMESLSHSIKNTNTLVEENIKIDSFTTLKKLMQNKSQEKKLIVFFTSVA